MAERGSAVDDFANQFWFETLLHGNFVEKCMVEREIQTI